MKQESSALVCNFCDKSEREVRTFVAGPEVYICDQCVQLGILTLCGRTVDQPAPFRTTEEESARCDFCSKTRNEVWKLLLGATCSICSECIEICHDFGIVEPGTEPLVAELKQGNDAHERRARKKV